ncbi:MAG: 30S ribosomal protein S6 [Chlorobi bacterium]|nr:30S ribosomal protein S6 [Chlorobiota bacterium]
MARHYETTVIINGMLEEKQINDAVERVVETITKHGGTISETDHWGRKRLAYPIGKKNNGYYVRFEYDASGEIVAPLARFCRIDDDILRELTLVLTERDMQKREETETRIAEAEAAAESAEQDTDDSGDSDIGDQGVDDE